MLIQGTGNDWKSWTLGLLVGRKEVNFTGGLAYGTNSALDHASQRVFSGRVSDVRLQGGKKHSTSVKRSTSIYTATCRTFGMLGCSERSILMG